MEKRNIIEILNDKKSWSIEEGISSYHLEEGVEKDIKRIADENMKYEKLFKMSKGHLPLSEVIELSKELKKLKGEYNIENEHTLEMFNKLIEAGEFQEKLLSKTKVDQEFSNIDAYMDESDIWFFPGGIIGAINLYGLREAVNFPLEGMELYGYLGKINKYYDVIRELKIIPNFPDEELLTFNKGLVRLRWSAYVKDNKEVVENRIRLDCDRVNEEMDLKEYEGKYKLKYVYRKYTPSKTVIEKLKEYVRKYLKEEHLKDLEIIFYPSEYEGFKKQRELFKDERYKFTGETLHITFDE